LSNTCTQITSVSDRQVLGERAPTLPDLGGWRRLDDHQPSGADLGILGVARDPARSVLWAVAWPAQPESGDPRASPGKGQRLRGQVAAACWLPGGLRLARGVWG
jgi:hypothetical protein